MEKYAVGIDIGGTTTKIGLFTVDGTLVERVVIPTDTSDHGAAILRDSNRTVRRILAENGIAPLEVCGIGVGVPGPVTKEGVVLRCVNLGWDVFDLETSFSQMTGFPVKAGNDADLAALGEVWKGSGQGFDNLVMVTLGTGIGAGIVLDGKILCGSRGAAGEIGHMRAQDGETEPCTCGNFGCLEQYASATGIVVRTERYLRDMGCASSLRDRTYDAKIIFDEAKKGDEAAVKMVDEMAETLGKVLAQVACVLNPDAFVLGGGMSGAGIFLLERVRNSFRRYAFHACKDAAFRLASLSNDAGIYGAAGLVIGV